MPPRWRHGEYLVFLNDDSTIEPDFLEHLMATVESDPSIGAVGSRIALPDGTLQEAGSVIWNNGSTTHIGLGLPTDTKRFNYLRDADYVSANGFLIRRSAWTRWVASTTDTIRRTSRMWTCA